MKILDVNNLNHRYQDGQMTKTALNDINASFEKGKMYAIIGPSGSGKTTLLSLISGLDSVQSGEILYNGKDIKRIGYSNYRRNHVNVVFQAYNLIKYLSAIQNVMAAMDIKKVAYKNKKERAEEILRKVGFTEDMFKRDILKLSGGEQQRVAIARALVHDSDLIMADEPTGNLDEVTEAEIMDIFSNLANEDKCVIIVTHSEAVAKRADVILRIRDGRLSTD